MEFGYNKSSCKKYNSAPTPETSNFVSVYNFDIDRNSPGFLFKHLSLNSPKKS